MTEAIAYLNGEFVPVSQASLHVFDLGVVGGMSVTEMVRTFHHKPFCLDEHLRRLLQSLNIVGFDLGMTLAELKAVCEQVVSENARLIPTHHDLGLIVFVTAGQNLTYLGHAGRDLARQTTVCVHTFPLPFELWAEKYGTGIHLVTVGTRSIPDDVIDTRIKHRSRLHWHLADREAKRVDAAAMAILCDHEGHLTETATGNLCLVDSESIFTPAKHVLEGISRSFVDELAASVPLIFAQQGQVTVDDLVNADEAFITSTPTCLLPVTKFNSQPISDGRPGSVFRKLIDAWSQVVGLDIVEQMRRGAMDRQSAS